MHKKHFKFPFFSEEETKAMRINLFKKALLSSWKANLDVQFVLESYTCVMYIVRYVSKSQRGMSVQLVAAAKEAIN